MATLSEKDRLGALVRFEKPNRFSHEPITVGAGADLEIGAVLGKITASGKYILSSPAASDGSQIPAAVLAPDAVALAADAKAVAFVRAARLNPSALNFHAAINDAAKRETAIAALAAAGMSVGRGAGAGSPAIVFAPAIDQPIVTSGAGAPVFATQTQHAPKRIGDDTTAVDVAGDTKFAYPGVPAGQLTAYPIAPRVRNEYIPGGDSQGRRWDMQIETVSSSKYLGVVWVPGATTSHLLVFVNGKPVSTRIECVGTTGSTSHFLLTFPDNRERRIKLVFSGGQQVVRLETEAAYPPARPASAGSTLVVVGDSLSAGAGVPPEGATYLDTWPQFAAYMLGFDHCCNASIGGSRWVPRTGASNIELSHFGGGRLPAALTLNPAAVVFAGSRNDTDLPSITAAVQAALQASAAVAERFVTGTFTALSQNALVKAGADAEGVAFIDMTDGFAPEDIGTDGVHPTYAGAVKLRDRIVPRLRAAGCVPL